MPIEARLPVAATTGLPPAARAELARALARLEAGPGPLVRAATTLGGIAGRFGQRTALRFGLSLAPGGRFDWIARVALARAYAIAIRGVPGKRFVPGTPAVIASGALGGFAGLAGFLPDATLTTLVILRDIAAIAEEQGEDLRSDSAQRACLEIFAFGGGDTSSYYATRVMLQSGPLAQLFTAAASRYGVVLGDKLLGQAIPIAGAAAGAALNAAFLAEYRAVARAHFTVRRLERVHGADAIQHASGR